MGISDGSNNTRKKNGETPDGIKPTAGAAGGIEPAIHIPSADDAAGGLDTGIYKPSADDPVGGIETGLYIPSEDDPQIVWVPLPKDMKDPGFSPGATQDPVTGEWGTFEQVGGKRNFFDDPGFGIEPVPTRGGWKDPGFDGGGGMVNEPIIGGILDQDRLRDGMVTEPDPQRIWVPLDPDTVDPGFDPNAIQNDKGEWGTFIQVGGKGNPDPGFGIEPAPTGGSWKDPGFDGGGMVHEPIIGGVLDQGGLFETPIGELPDETMEAIRAIFDNLTATTGNVVIVLGNGDLRDVGNMIRDVGIEAGINPDDIKIEPYGEDGRRINPQLESDGPDLASQRNTAPGMNSPS